MRIVEIESLENGAHRNQQSEFLTVCPEGWAIIPDDMAIPDTFPFVDIEVEDGVVTEMTPGEVPPEPPEEPSAEEILDIMLGEEVGE